MQHGVIRTIVCFASLGSEQRDGEGGECGLDHCVYPYVHVYSTASRNLLDVTVTTQQKMLQYGRLCDRPEGAKITGQHDVTCIHIDLMYLRCYQASCDHYYSRENA